MTMTETQAGDQRAAIAEWTVRRTLEELAESLPALRHFADKAERGGAEPQGVREFAVQAVPTSGPHDRQPWLLGSDMDLAAARARVQRVSSRDRELNRSLGMERVEVVSRWRFELADGSTIITPWQTCEED